jgi:hypothetical protein
MNQVPREPLYLQGGFPPSPTAGEHFGAAAEGSGEVSDSDLVQGDCFGVSSSAKVHPCGWGYVAWRTWRFCNAHYSTCCVPSVNRERTLAFKTLQKWRPCAAAGRAAVRRTVLCARDALSGHDAEAPRRVAARRSVEMIKLSDGCSRHGSPILRRRLSRDTVAKRACFSQNKGAP